MDVKCSLQRNRTLRGDLRSADVLEAYSSSGIHLRCAERMAAGGANCDRLIRLGGELEAGGSWGDGCRHSLKFSRITHEKANCGSRWSVSGSGVNKMTDPANTSATDLMRAAEIGRRAGLRYVYAGNLPGKVGDFESTRCATCAELLISRFGYLITEYRITSDGCCPSCCSKVPGRWADSFRPQITDRPFLPLSASRPANEGGSWPR